MALKNKTMPSKLSTTGVKYLNIDRGYKLKVGVQIKNKYFIVWRGQQKDFEIGKKIAEKVQDKMLQGESAFLEWYDYEMEGWMNENGY